MTSNSTVEDSLRPSFDDHLCYRSGDWICYRDLTISAEDIGFRQGVVAVERLRTYGGIPFQVSAHLNRWQHTTKTLGIEELPSLQQIKAILFDLLGRNEILVRDQTDLGITLFATPGPIGVQSSGPTLALHLNPLDHPRIRQRREQGQALIVTDVQQPSEQVWPRSIKVRSRIHYYFADRFARKLDSDALGVLIDSADNVTETSIANLAIVRSGEIISPPSETILGGITQMVTESLAGKAGMRWTKQCIKPAELRHADEVLLMGTDGGIWYANSVDGQTLGDGQPGRIYQQLKVRFDQTTSGH